VRFFEFRVRPVDSVYKTPQDKPRQPQTHLSKTKKTEPAAKVNLAHELEKYKRLSEAKSKCPPATQDITLNLKNRQKAIDEYGYGPLNPDLPNNKFWLKKVDEWNLDSVEEAKSSLCGNCAAFDVRRETLDCIAKGIGDDTEAAEGVIDAGELGYCRFLKFKCASKRTCDAWVTGGPLVDKIDEGNDQEFYTGGSPGLPYPSTYEQEYGPFTHKGQRRITAMTNEEQIEEKWSDKYKRSINCNNPKGFSQKAHCQGRKKK
jgi:hypothetical protein